MTKKEFVELYAAKGEMTKKDAEKFINLFLESVEECLEKGETVSFVGWGKWEVVKRAPRDIRNPRSKEKMHLKAKSVVKFRVGKGLAEKVEKVKVKAK